MNKTSSTLLFLLAAVIVTSGCTGSSANPDQQTGVQEADLDPEDLIQKYHTEFSQSNSGEAYELLSSDVQGNSQMKEVEHKMEIDSSAQTSRTNWDFQIKEFEIESQDEGEKIIRLEKQYWLNDNLYKEMNKSIGLVKENGDWKIDEAYNPYSREGEELFN